MNFDLSEEQQLLQETLGQFLSDQCSPQQIRDLAEEDTGFDAELWKGLGHLGIVGLHAPEAFGGAGLDVLDLACAAEILGFHAAPGPFFGHALAIRAIALGGSEAQKECWLPGLASGESIGTVALAETEADWSPNTWKVDASPTLSGRKTFVPHADRADLIVVGLAGGRLGVVERGSTGLTCAPIESSDWTRPLVDVEFSNCPVEPLPGGSEVARRVIDTGLVLIAADAFGGGKRLLEMCVDHALTREQFGVKIGSFQALKHQLADLALEIEPNRGLYWYAAYLHDREEDEASRMASLAKAHNSDRFADTARAAVEIHGGIGFTWEGDVQIWCKRALFDRAFLGGPRAHRRRQAQLGSW